MRQALATAAEVPGRLRQIHGQRQIFRVCRPMADCETRYLGSDWGGWTVNPSLIGLDSVVYSFGLGEDVSFDRALVETYGVTVHGFEPDPLARAFLADEGVPERLTIHEYGLAGYDGGAVLHPSRPSTPRELSGGRTLVPDIGPRAQAHEIHDVRVKRLPTIMAELGHERVDLVKIDIEGAEYDVLDDLLASGIRPAQLLVEFHHHLPGIAVGATLRAIRGLKEAGFRPFFLSDRYAEVGFLQV